MRRELPNGNPVGSGYVLTSNKQRVVDTVGGTTVGYTYDGLNRLTDANTTAGGTDHRSYGYDADGNRTSQTINGTNTTYTYNNADQATTTGYSYDADGNGKTTQTLSNLTYNPLKQTTAITKSGTTTNFGYAGDTQDTRTSANNIDAALSSLGIDVEASTGSVYHFYIRDPAGNLLAIVNDNAGTLTTRYTVLDGIGSVTALTDGSGSIKDTWKYDPYGNVISHTGTDYNPFQYTGSYTDATTGLIHDGARYYNPTDGRFTQQDPSGQEANLYAYAGDDPLDYADPTGLSFLNISLDLCLGVCVNLGVDVSSTGGLTPTLSVGVGPDVAADVSETAETGSPESGASLGVACSVGPVEGDASVGLNGAGVGAGFTTGADAGCEGYGTYTF